MAEHMNLYEQARYYDIIFDSDRAREAGFLADVFRTHSGTSRPEGVLDVACGPGYHARAFSREGVRAVGVDLNEAMIDLAAEKDRLEGLTGEWHVADMRDFRLDEPVELAFVMFDGLDALLTNQDLVAHLRAVADNLSPHGLYVIDLSHPRECSFSNYAEFRYRGERDGVRVEIEWGTNRPHFDLVTGIADVELELRVFEGGQTRIVKDHASERLLLPQELTLLAALSGTFSVVGWYGDYDVMQPLDWTDKSRRMIAVLRRERA